MKKALVLGGNSGIGLTISIRLLNEYDHIYILGRNKPDVHDISTDYLEQFKQKTQFIRVNLNEEDYSVFDEIQDIDSLVITAGFGRPTLFENLNECEIKNLINCNELSIIQVVRKYFSRIKSQENFNCAIITSICGRIVSPFFSVYGAAKSGLSMFIENINTELMAEGYNNRVLNCSPGHIDGTKFSGERNDIAGLFELADDIIENMNNKVTLLIPDYERIYKSVIERYNRNPIEFGIQSYDYKLKSGRVNNNPQIVVGFLSGTFDLFHIGHLNLLRRAKENCDYLIVSIHNSGAWKGKDTFIPYEERVEIVKSIKYVDEVVKDYKEDVDAWNDLHFNKLFVGSDYKGTERFNRYEEYFCGRGVEIIYFPYTNGTSSTQLRNTLTKRKK